MKLSKHLVNPYVTDLHGDCFKLLAIMNKSTKNILENNFSLYVLFLLRIKNKNKKYMYICVYKKLINGFPNGSIIFMLLSAF